MKLRTIARFLLTGLTAAGMIGLAQAQNDWTGGTSTDWADSTNWSTGAAPPAVGFQQVRINNVSDATPFAPSITSFYNTAPNGAGGDMFIGWGTTLGVGTLDIDSGGTLDGSGNWIFLGNAGGTGTINVNAGGSLVSDNHIRLDSATSTVNIAAGATVNVGAFVGAGSVRLLDPSVDLTTNQDGTVDNIILGSSYAGSIFTSGGPFNLYDTTGGSDNTHSIAGADIRTGSEFWIGNELNNAATLTMTSGSIESNQWFVVGRNGSTGVYTQDGGSLTQNAEFIGIGTNNGAGDGDGTFNLNAGTVTAPGLMIAENGGSTGVFNMAAGTTVTLTGTTGAANTQGLTLGGADTPTATANLNGGTLNTTRIRNLSGGGTALLNLNGTDINLTADAPGSFFGGAVLEVDLQATTTVINTNGFDGTGDAFFTGTGGIDKQGAGHLGLNGEGHDFTGDISVSEGSITVGGAASFGFSGSVTMSDGTGFGVRANQLDDLIEPFDLTVGTTSSELTFDFVDADFFIPFAPISVQNSLNLSGTITVNLAGINFTSGEYELIDYSLASKTGSATWVVGSLPDGVTASSIVDDGSRIYINVSAGSYTWTGETNGDWDTATINWEDNATFAPTNFSNGALVTFADSSDFATSVNTFNVTITEDVFPVSVLFTHETETYTLTDGGGVIAGGATLTTEGAGDLDLSGITNTFTGTTTLGGSGTVSVPSFPAGGVAGPLGDQANTADTLVFAGATLDVASAAAVSVDRNFTLAPGTTTTIITSGDMTFDTTIPMGTGGIAFGGPGDVFFTYAVTDFSIGGGNPALRINEGTLNIDTPVVMTVGGELHVGNEIGVGADMNITDTTLNVSSWIGVSRGTAGATSNVAITNSTVTAGNLSLGWDRGTGAPNNSVSNMTLDNSSMEVTGDNFISESFQTETNLVLQNGSSLEFAVAMRVGWGDTSLTNITLNDTSTLLGNGDFNLGGGGSFGTINVTLNGSADITHDNGGWFMIGDGRDGANDSVTTITLNDSATLNNLNGDMGLGSEDTATGILNLNDSATAWHDNNNWTFVGRGEGDDASVGVININGAGASFNSSDDTRLGQSGPSTGTVNVNDGTFAVSDSGPNSAGDGEARLIVGVGGTGTINVDGGDVRVTGTATTIVAEGGGSTGTINLNTGTFESNSVTVGGGTGTLNFGGGTLLARGSVSPFLSVPTVVGAGGGTIDNNGSTIGITSAVTGTGTLTCVGSGGTTSFTSTIACAELVAGSGVTEITSDSALDNSITVDVTSAAGATLNLTHIGFDTISFFEVDGVDQGTGVFNATTHPGVITGTGNLNVTGGATPYDTWAAGYWSTTDLGNPSISGPDGDGNNNGTPNKVYFAHGGDPTSPTGAPQIFFLEEDSDADGDATTEFLLTIAVRAGTPAFAGSPSPSATHDGFTVTVQGSNDIEDRTAPVSVAPTPVTTGLGAAPAGYEWRTFSLDGSNGLTGSGYMNTTVK